jgi:hypothetical protein
MTVPTKYLTRDDLYELLRGHGYPIDRSTLDKLCMPSCGEGPPVAAYWPGAGANQRPLYEAETALAWAESRLRRPANVAKARPDNHQSDDQEQEATAPQR